MFYCCCCLFFLKFTLEYMPVFCRAFVFTIFLTFPGNIPQAHTGVKAGDFVPKAIAAATAVTAMPRFWIAVVNGPTAADWFICVLNSCSIKNFPGHVFI